MLRKVCLFVDWNMYEVVRHFTKKLAEAFERRGIAAQIIDANQEDLDPLVFRDFFDNPPDITCSFNRIAKVGGKKFLWDILKIPHVAFLVDPPLYYLDLTPSRYIILTSVDRSDARAVKEIFPRVFFWPHAIEGDLDAGREERVHDVVFFGSCFDYRGLKREWESKFSKDLCSVLERAIEIALEESLLPLTQVLSQAWEESRLDKALGQANFLLLYHYLEKYMLGRDRLELLAAIKDAEVDVYGEAFPLSRQKQPEWKDLLPNNPNIRFHSPVPYTETFEILKRSKLCLNSVPSFRDGTHERIFSGFACGALPVTSESKYLMESFKPGEELLFYKTGHWEGVNDILNTYLSNDKKRREAAARGREKVMRFHTWDARVAQLLEELPPLLVNHEDREEHED